MNSKEYPAHREELGTWLNTNNLIGEGAEIGVAFGGFSRIILESWSGKLLHMVDLWGPQDPSVYKESTNQTAPFKTWHAEALEIASRYNRAVCHQGSSVEVATTFKDGQLDFVYIDANHSAEAVTEDLSAWWPKVKIGGILGGHDFMTKHDEGWWCGVETAVTKWAHERTIAFEVTPCCSFWMPKLK